MKNKTKLILRNSTTEMANVGIEPIGDYFEVKPGEEVTLEINIPDDEPAAAYIDLDGGRLIISADLVART